jgi:hypothetical protein
VEHDPGRELQAQRRRVVGELPGRPQQVLRPLAAGRRYRLDHVPADAAASGDTDDGRHRPI